MGGLCWRVLLVATMLGLVGGGQALAYPTLSPTAVVASSASDGHEPNAVADGNWLSRWQAREEREGAWVELRLPGPVSIGAVVIVDHADEAGSVGAIRLSFADGSAVDYALPPSSHYPGLDQPGTLFAPVDEQLARFDPVSGLVHAFDQQSSDPSYARNKGPFLIRFPARVTDFVRVTVTEMAREGVPASLAEAGAIAITDSDPQPQATPGQLAVLPRSAFGLTAAAPPGSWRLANAELALTVSPTTGLITRLTSLQPTPVDLCAEGETPATTLYLRCVDRGWEDRFTVLKAYRRDRGHEGGQPYERFTCVIAPAEHPVAYAIVTYRLFPDRLETDVDFQYLVDDWPRYRFGLYHNVRPEDWPTHRDSGTWNDTRLAYSRCYSHAYDACWEQGDWSLNILPLDVIQREDRYFLYGSFDLEPHFVFGPNVPRFGAYPSVYVMPFGLREGDGYRLQLFYKSLSRERQGYMEALRWYCRRTRFDDPDFRGIPVRLTQTVARTLPPGRICSSPRPAYPMDSEAKLAEMERWMQRTWMTNALYGGWDAWVHPPESITEGQKWDGYAGNLSGERMRRELGLMRRRGINGYVYINNFVRPPWVQDRLIDTDNDREREWYLARLKSFIEYLRPSGIFWDAGWWPISWAPPNYNHSSDPRGDTLKGWLKLQALSYVWIKQHYPDMHVIMNLMAGGSPSQFFTDGVIIEGGGISSPMLVQDSRALLTAVGAYHSPFYYDIGPPMLQERGLKFTDLAETGLPEDFTAALWERFMRGGVKSVGLGASLGGDPNVLVEHEPARRRVFPEYAGWAFYMPRSRQTPELDEFCGLANATPVAGDTFAVTASRSEVTGALWAGKERLLASLYNDSDEAVEMTAHVDRPLLAAKGCVNLGPLRVWVLGALGEPLPVRSLSVSATPAAIVISGRLGPRELALVRAEAVGP